MIDCRTAAKVREILECVLKYSAFFWEIYTNLTYRDSKRAKALAMVFTAGIFVFVSRGKGVRNCELITA
jgi:hypothetical protein